MSGVYPNMVGIHRVRASETGSSVRATSDTVGLDRSIPYTTVLCPSSHVHPTRPRVRPARLARPPYPSAQPASLAPLVVLLISAIPPLVVLPACSLRPTYTHLHRRLRAPPLKTTRLSAAACQRYG